MNAHIRDLQRRHHTSGSGHIYQGRYRSSTILTERHLLAVCRYVEANGLAAGLSERAELWPWSSLARKGPAPDIDILQEWPVPRPANWLDQVNRPLGDRVWTTIKKEIRKSQPDVRFLRSADPVCP